MENWGYIGEEYVVSQGKLFSWLAKPCPDSCRDGNYNEKDP